MKVALVHDWMIHMRGGEKVLEALAELYPGATVYTLFCDKSRLSPALAEMDIRTSWLQRLPGIKKYYRWLLPLLPYAMRSLKIEAADLVISSSHCVAKGIQIPKGAFHICYCHTPMRYLWGFEEEYFGKFPILVKPFVRTVLRQLRKWDLRTNTGVNEFISNSENVRERIQLFYGREATVIHPPLDTARYQANGDTPKNYYLVVSHFVPYKRVDLVIDAFNALDRQLLVVGSGPLERAYRKRRKSGKISFLGSLSDARLRELYAGAKALIFPTEEDFGIVPLEAQACGTPVIAYGRGGALESVKTGLFFNEQTPEAIQQAVLKFEKQNMERAGIAAKVEAFDRRHFKAKIQSFVEEHYPAQPIYAHR